MIAELAGATSAIVQGRQMHADDEQHPHWRGLGLCCMVLGALAVGWLLIKHKGRLFR